MKREVNLNIKRRGILSRIFSRATLFALLFLAQIALVLYFAVELTHYYALYYWLGFVLSLVALIIMLFKKSELPYAVTWLIIIILFPIMGAAVYIAISLDPFPFRMRKRIKEQEYDMALLQTFNQQNIKDLDKVDSRYSGVANYLSYSAASPTFKNNPLRYYASGEESLRDFLKDLRSAKKFIFLEFFIVKQGTFLQEILSILREKAKEGVEIKFLYDGFNAMLSLPFSYPKRLASVGIETRVFSPQKTPFFHRESYRSHRKSVIIDGKIAYVGGVNIGDEYVNRITRFGYWKDALLRVEGTSVSSITLSFLGMWDHGRKKQLDKSKYLLHPSEYETYKDTHNFVIPYSDNPIDEENTGFNVYLEIINKATDYVYISSPYLVIESEFIKALQYASKRGVDVRILVPFIPDKKIPNYVAKSYYKRLVEAGIKIYEYTPGFNHAKLFVSDDVVFTVGSINLDYRSFYLSYENNVFAYDKALATTIRKDLEKAYKQSKLINKQELKHIKKHQLILGYLFRFFAPLF